MRQCFSWVQKAQCGVTSVFSMRPFIFDRSICVKYELEPIPANFRMRAVVGQTANHRAHIDPTYIVCFWNVGGSQHNPMQAQGEKSSHSSNNGLQSFFFSTNLLQILMTKTDTFTARVIHAFLTSPQDYD